VHNEREAKKCSKYYIRCKVWRVTQTRIVGETVRAYCCTIGRRHCLVELDVIEISVKNLIYRCPAVFKSKSENLEVWHGSYILIVGKLVSTYISTFQLPTYESN
jgi:hypothetical protein